MIMPCPVCKGPMHPTRHEGKIIWVCNNNSCKGVRDGGNK